MDYVKKRQKGLAKATIACLVAVGASAAYDFGWLPPLHYLADTIGRRPFEVAFFVGVTSLGAMGFNAFRKNGWELRNLHGTNPIERFSNKVKGVEQRNTYVPSVSKNAFLALGAAATWGALALPVMDIVVQQHSLQENYGYLMELVSTNALLLGAVIAGGTATIKGFFNKDLRVAKKSTLKTVSELGKDVNIMGDINSVKEAMFNKKNNSSADHSDSNENLNNEKPSMKPLGS